MVVGEDHGGCVARQRLPDDLPRMHTGAVDGTAEQLLEGDQPMPGIQVHAAEHLIGSIAQLREQKAAGGLRGIQCGTGLEGFAVVATGQLQCGLQQAVAGWPQPMPGQRLNPVRAQQLPQRPELRQQPVRQIDRGSAAAAGAKKDRQQFGIGQALGTLFHKLFPRSLAR